MKAIREFLAKRLTAKGIGLAVVLAIVVVTSWIIMHRVAHARTPTLRLAPLEEEMDDDFLLQF